MVRYSPHAYEFIVKIRNFSAETVYYQYSIQELIHNKLKYLSQGGVAIR